MRVPRVEPYRCRRTWAIVPPIPSHNGRSPVADRSDDLPLGLVFSSLRDSPGRRRRLLLFLTTAAVAGLALIWPIYPAVSGIRPYVLGLPFSLAWIVGALTLVFGALVWFYRAEEGRADDPST